MQFQFCEKESFTCRSDTAGVTLPRRLRAIVLILQVCTEIPRPPPLLLYRNNRNNEEPSNCKAPISPNLSLFFHRYAGAYPSLKGEAAPTDFNRFHFTVRLVRLKDFGVTN